MKKILLSTSNILRRLPGKTLNLKDKNKNYLLLGSHVFVYYNIFDIHKLNRFRDRLFGIIEFNPKLNVYYIEIDYSLNKIIYFDSDQYILREYFTSQEYDNLLFINNSLNVEIDPEYKVENLCQECSEILKEKGEKEFYKKIMELYNNKQIKFADNELSNIFIDLNDENLKLILKFSIYKEIIHKLDFNRLIKRINELLKRSNFTENYGVFEIPESSIDFDSPKLCMYNIYWKYDIGDGIKTSLIFSDHKL